MVNLLNGKKINLTRTEKDAPKAGMTNIKGKLKVLNTLNEFNLLDKNELLDGIGREVT